MKKLIHWLLLSFSAMLIITLNTSCEEENGSLAGRSMINGNLYKIDPETNVVEKDTLASLTVTAIDTDSVIINNQTNVMDISLPLRYTSNYTVLVFNYNDEENSTLNDTVYLKQNNTPFFESMKCGYTMTQVLTGVEYTKHMIDSIYILNPNANVNGTENLKIFYRYTY